MKKLGGKRQLFFLSFYFLPLIVIASTVGFVLPIKGSFSTSLTLGESWKNGALLLGHMGDDMVVDAGTNVYAAADGKVVYVRKWPLCDVYKKVNGVETLAESDHGWGGVVIIEHALLQNQSFIVQDSYVTPDGIDLHPQVVYTQYGHLGNITVEEGQEVSIDQKIAEVGNMCKWRPHLHFEVKTKQGYLDDLGNSRGAGFGYSGTDSYAPQRYAPIKFVGINASEKNTESENIPVFESTTPPPPSPSFFTRIKSFFSSLFSSDDSSASTGQVVTRELPEQQDNEKEEEKTPESGQPNAVFLPAHISLSVSPGQTETHVIVFAKNTGNTTWQKNTMSLNVVGGASVNQDFYHPSWLTSLRPTRMVEHTVPPGEVGSFAFRVTVPQDLSKIFRLQLVQQEGGSFTQIGTTFVFLSFSSKVPEIGEVSPVPQDESTFFDTLEQIKDVLGDKITNVFHDIADLAPHIFFYGGGSEIQPIEEPLVDETEETTEEAALPTPDLRITTPTTTSITTNTGTAYIFGTFNDDVSRITVNGTSTEALIMDIVSSTWKFRTSLEEHVTTTFSFIGWSASITVSSTPVSVSYLYSPPEPDLPEIAITSPTSTLFVTTSTQVRIAGIFNETTDYLTINGTTSSAFVYDAMSSIWSIAVNDILANATTTYEFIGWNASSTVSSTPISVDIFFESETSPLAEAPTILTPSTTSTTVTKSMHVAMMGNTSPSIVSVVLDQGGSSTTVPVIDREWSAHLVMQHLGVSQIVVYGIDEFGIHTATTSVFVEVERLDALGYIGFSEIAWMGTEASAQDEWFEIMMLESPNNADFSVLEPYRDELVVLDIVWGEYDTQSNTYEHHTSVSNDDIRSIMSNEPDATIDIGQEAYIDPIQVVFERTDNTTLKNARGIVYTGDLKNTGESMKIMVFDEFILDEVHASAQWFAGDALDRQVMHRIDPRVSGNDPNNWCTFDECPEETQYIGEKQVFDADDTLVNGSPYSPNIVLPPDLKPQL